ncbi:MAG: GNAT family N-acetyltransferase [Bacteroidetes bacterium]|nr:GNAT family N-acetyltransferase [Bacteroidota bacterium]
MTPFTLRPFTPDDIPSLAIAGNNPNISGNLTNRFPHPYTEEHAAAFIQMAGSTDPVRIFAIDIGGQVAGGIGIHPQEDIWHNNAELGYWVAEPFWGQGIVTEAIRRMLDFAFTRLPNKRIFARPFGRNIASQKALERNGFILEARLTGTIEKNGNVEDELIYRIWRHEWEQKTIG